MDAAREIAALRANIASCFVVLLGHLQRWDEIAAEPADHAMIEKAETDLQAVSAELGIAEAEDPS